MSDAAWELYDGLVRALHRQGREVEDLKARVLELERKLGERDEVAKGENDDDRRT